MPESDDVLPVNVAPRDGVPLGPDERAELERLRAENSELRGRGGGPGPARGTGRGRGWWRTLIATVLIVIGCVLAPLSVIAVWTANQVSNTDRYVANVAPLIHERSIQNALTDKITTAITNQLNIQAVAEQAATGLSDRGLPRAGDLLGSLAPQLAGAADGFIHSQVARVLASPHSAALWVNLNRTAHAQVVKVLSGQGGSAVTVTDGKVTVSLGPFIQDVQASLVDRGFTLASKIPPVNPTVTLFTSENLGKAQTLYRLLNDLKIVLPVATGVFLVLGIYAARGRRRALLGASLGVVAGMFVLGVGLAVARSIYLTSVPSSLLPPDAAATLFDTLVGFIRDGLRLIAVIALIIAVLAFFFGPAGAGIRRGTVAGISAGAARLRRTSVLADLRGSGIGDWTARHWRALDISAVAVAVIIFLFWPAVSVAIVLAVILLLVLGFTELVGRRREPAPAGPAPPGHPAP